ncbi:RagB/SusD family nutrient uptake outer membrane protein [Sphingobacterium rhinopitheci]|uniref:RagB/SusD family nutrient uptake outer membrane protein n=1 Tax=Sphingobacterium rhinopitheci TaxID=2781960 RepID=UPI001F524AF6|nr:RagB/SusD family nutrient uptake outer membrane protein [Sphingobacterium rhinopitheci]MCI0920408.1 RagB/SusD family nutrient uptake outer membrane protein [Sphingobacterium rhinopitheci]
MKFNKKIKYSALALMTSVVFSMNSCSVDVVPQDRLAEGVVWTDPISIDLYSSGLYSEFKNFQFGLFPGLGYDNAMDALSDIMKFTSTVSGNGTVNTLISNSSSFSPASVGLNYWSTGYTRIRRINEFINGLYERSSLSDSEKLRYESEARFVRAWTYFWLAKLHGSVIILKDINEYANKDNARSSEEAVYDFMIDDLKFAAANLAATSKAGTANKMAANALLSRVALYAGSIAKYDLKQYNDDPLTGISTGRAKEFYQIAADAAQAVIGSGQFALETNFASIFSNKNTKEAIFRVDFSAPQITHQYDFGYAPPRDNNGNTMVYGVPTAELVNEYEMADGTKFSWANATHAANPYKDREPRFYATILHNGATWKGRTMNTSTTDPIDGFALYGESAEPRKTVTGYYAKKLLDTANTTFAVNKSTQSWIELRLGEVYLNLAEAKAGLEDYQGAAATLSELRAKRGINNVTFNTAATALTAIEHERKVELAFEGHRFWDLRRWRKAHITLNGIRVTGHKIEPNDTGFTYTVVPADNLDRSFSSRLYYLPIPEGEIQVNLALTQIKGW